MRNPDGSTTWLVDGRTRLHARQNTDLLTPVIAEALQRSWELYEETLAWEEARHLGILDDARPAPPPEPEPPF